MPKVNIDYNSPLNAQETFQRVKDVLANDEGLKKIDANIQSSFDESALSGDLKGSKFKAQMSVKEAGDKANVSIVVDLPMLLGAFKGQVKSTIERKLEKALS
ncbi:MAG: polyhydroxyalkanoic acid system family protein [Pseudomonadota bacterium]